MRVCMYLYVYVHIHMYTYICILVRYTPNRPPLWANTGVVLESCIVEKDLSIPGTIAKACDTSTKDFTQMKQIEGED